MHKVWRYLRVPCVLLAPWVAYADNAATDLGALQADPAYQAVVQFAQNMLEHGRDVYGPTHSALFAAQLNIRTQQIPTGADSDPGVWNGHLEVAGHQPYCENLIADLGLLDLLKVLTKVSGDEKYDAARRAYLSHLLTHCRDPRSGYIPWGEHVGYDIVHDTIHVGEVKYWHEVKAFNIPWDDLWDIDFGATRHEIETAFYNHICNEDTFAFNRHATMDGKPNLGNGPTSLLSSAGVYIDAWCWLYKKTGEEKFLRWARKMNDMVAARKTPATGLIPTDEVTRGGIMVYAEAASYAPYLFIAADTLGPQGDSWKVEALNYLIAYDKYAYVPRRDDTGACGFYDSLDTTSGLPGAVNGVRYLEPWKWTDNHEHVGVILSSAAIGYVFTGDDRVKTLAERAIAALDIPGAVQRGTRLLSCDAAGAIMSLVQMARKSGDAHYLEQARPLVDYALAHNYAQGYFTCGMEGKDDYYCARAGSGYLACAILSYALASHGFMNDIPPVRDLQGGLRF